MNLYFTDACMYHPASMSLAKHMIGFIYKAIYHRHNNIVRIGTRKHKWPPFADNNFRYNFFIATFEYLNNIFNETCVQWPEKKNIGIFYGLVQSSNNLNQCLLDLSLYLYKESPTNWYLDVYFVKWNRGKAKHLLHRVISKIKPRARL